MRIEKETNNLLQEWTNEEEEYISKNVLNGHIKHKTGPRSDAPNENDEKTEKDENAYYVLLPHILVLTIKPDIAVVLKIAC